MVNDPVLRPLIPFAPKARRLSDRMQRAWIEFARCGDPSHGDLPDWPTYDAGGGATLKLAPHCRIEEAPFADAVRFWECVEGGRAPR